MIREIKFEPAFDKRHSDPKKNYGIHGVTMTWYLKGTELAIQFVVYTNWHLPYVQAELDARHDREFPHLSCHPMAADIGYHSRHPRYEGQTLMSDQCHVLDGPCYYDGSSLQAEDILKTLITEGGEAVWQELERRYKEMVAEEEVTA